MLRLALVLKSQHLFKLNLAAGQFRFFLFSDVYFQYTIFVGRFDPVLIR